MSLTGIDKLRPPVPRGLSSGVQSAADVERYRNGKQVVVYSGQSTAERWPTAPPMPPDRLIESSEWRYTREDAARTTALMKQVITATKSRAITGLPDCRGATCDGMCGNPDCDGDQVLRRTASALQPRWRIAVAGFGSIAVGAVVVAAPLPLWLVFPLAYVASSLLFAWAFWKRR